MTILELSPTAEVAPDYPDVSIIMPVYNAANTLAATITSIQKQSYKRFELIAIDDGSSDSSLSCLLEFAANDERIKVIARDNAGVSATRNLGAELARGTYIAFIDADDIWAHDKLDQHVALHESYPWIAASYARVAFIPENAQALHEASTTSSLCPHSPELIDVLGENPVCTTSNLVIRRKWFDQVGGFDTKLSFAEDQDFVANLIARGGRLVGIDTVLIGYRFSSDGLSMQLNHMHHGWRIVARRYLEDGPVLKSLESLYCRYLARRVLRAGGRPITALSYAMAGLRLDAATFLRERRRSIPLLLAVLAYPAIPSNLRRRLFA